MITKNDIVKSTEMPKDSFYKEVVGKVKNIRNGWADVDVIKCMDKWSDKLEKHPGKCTTSIKVKNLITV